MFYNYAQTQFEIRTVSGQSLVNSYSLPAAYSGADVLGIDPVTHWALLIKNSELIVFDFENGVEKFRIKTNYAGVSIFDGVLYAYLGERLKMN